MTFKQILGFAFKNWTQTDCEQMIELAKENKAYILGSKVARYVIQQKYCNVNKL